jgi:hypothetical protein
MNTGRVALVRVMASASETVVNGITSYFNEVAV